MSWSEVAGLRPLQRRRDERVAEEEVGGIDQHASALLGDDGQRGQNGGREGLGHDPAPLLVGDAAAVRRLELPQKDPGADALEATEAEARRAVRGPARVDEPGPTREPRAVEQVLVRRRDLEEELPLRGVPVVRHETVVTINPSRGRRWDRSVGKERRGGREQENRKQK